MKNVSTAAEQVRSDKSTRYYSRKRPILPGGYPEKDKVILIQNFDQKKYCDEIGTEAWGYIEYRIPLNEEQVDAYELTLAGLKTYWCVTTSVYNSGRIISHITDCIQSVAQPQDEFKELRTKDVYIDWFASKVAAEQFVLDAKKA